MIVGETVYVACPSNGAADPFGKPSESWDWDAADEVGNVLVSPGSTSDLGAERPNGVEVAYTLYFPKAFSGSLRGCRVRMRGGEFSVIGDPGRYPEHLTPGDWNMQAEVSRVDG